SLPPEKLKEHDRLTWNITFKNVYPDENNIFEGPLNLPSRKWMRKVEERHGRFRIWDAEITWVQPYSKKTGTLTTNFYHSDESGPYYQILSHPLCYWEGEADVISKIYENTNDFPMSISRDSGDFSENLAGTGMTLGYNNNYGNPHPL